jgi:hypothetical protein
VLEQMQASAAPPAIRPGPIRFAVGGDRFTVETEAGTVVAAGVTEVEAHLAGRTQRASRQHVADRLVTVVAG